MFHAENAKRLTAACEGGLVVVAGYDAMQLSGDMQAPFLQEANFWWLTGIEEPGWKAIIDTARHRTVLVRPQLTDVQQVFSGGMTDDEALKVSGAQAVLQQEQFEHELKQLARTHPRVLTVAGVHEDIFYANPAQAKIKGQLERIFEHVELCDKQLAELRAIKQPEEIARIKKAIKLSTSAYVLVRELWQDYAYEYEVEAAFTYEFRRHAATHAYAPIVAAGKRACTLHYDSNAHGISKKDAVVIDIGARYKGYAADITRTYSLAPSKRIMEVHGAVQHAQKSIIKLLKPDLLVSEYISAVDIIMKEQLISLGLMKDMSDTGAYRRYFPHAIGHGLGVDVHDSLGVPRYFKPGMVLTVEPGIYIPEEAIGVRIEDDILITENGHQNMSGSLSTDL